MVEPLGVSIMIVDLLGTATQLSGQRILPRNHLKLAWQVRRNVLHQELLLRDAISSILSDATGSSTLDADLEDPSSLLWTDPRLSLQIRDSLGHESYDIFRALNADILANARALLAELDKLEKLPKWRRLPRQDSRIKRLLEELDKNINRLTQFVAHDIGAKHLTAYKAIKYPSEEVEKELEKIQRRPDEGRDEHQPLEPRVLKEVEAIRQLLEQRELGGAVEESDDDNGGVDLESVYSVESEAESEASSLSYLPLSIRHVDSKYGTQLQEDALLDTGASACAISLTVARNLGLDIVEDDETMIRTAALDQELVVKGTTYVALRWRDEHGNRYGRKTRVFVVYGLSKPILLSHDFIKNNPEVSQIARTVVSHLRDEINGTFFTKLSKDKQRDQDAFTADKTQENRERAAEKKRQKLKELVDRLQRNNQEPAAPSIRSVDVGSQASAD